MSLKSILYILICKLIKTSIRHQEISANVLFLLEEQVIVHLETISKAWLVLIFRSNWKLVEDYVLNVISLFFFFLETSYLWSWYIFTHWIGTVYSLRKRAVFKNKKERRSAQNVRRVIQRRLRAPTALEIVEVSTILSVTLFNDIWKYDM